LKSVSIDPYNLKALMMLGVSYTNDLEEHRALNYLKTWLLNNPDYQHPSIQQFKQSIQQYESMYGSDSGGTQQGPIVDVTLHDEVTRMFLAALQLSPQDAELHQVLGVLYHITGDFDKAIDSFKRAIDLKPDSAQLWNKLGATQANSSRSSDAVYAYQRALELRPAYVRALANLAISYANQGMHEEAVKQYLITLTHNPNANHIWSYLRISLSHLGKDDLVELSQQKNVELFRPHYQF
jgi:peroxin-5